MIHLDEISINFAIPAKSTFTENLLEIYDKGETIPFILNLQDGVAFQTQEATIDHLVAKSDYIIYWMDCLNAQANERWFMMQAQNQERKTMFPEVAIVKVKSGGNHG